MGRGGRQHVLCSVVSYYLSPCEVGDLRAEFQQENEELLEAVRQLSREVALQTLLMDSFIPPEYQVWLGAGVAGSQCSWEP